MYNALRSQPCVGSSQYAPHGLTDLVTKVAIKELGRRIQEHSPDDFALGTKVWGFGSGKCHIYISEVMSRVGRVPTTTVKFFIWLLQLIQPHGTCQLT